MANDNALQNELISTENAACALTQQYIRNTLGKPIRQKLAENTTWHGFVDLDDPSQGYFCDIEKITDIAIDTLIEYCFDSLYIAIA